MNKKRFVAFVVLLGAVLVLGFTAQAAFAQQLTAREQLGKNLFFDTDLSEPAGQGCVSCHHPDEELTQRRLCGVLPRIYPQGWHPGRPVLGW